MDKFKKFTKKVIESNKLAWQQMCSPMYKKFDITELRKIAKLEGIPFYKTLSKRELCLELSIYLSKLIIISNKLKNKCINSTTIDLEDIKNLPPHKLYPLVFNDNTQDHIYCFDIEEIYKYTQTNKTNPYNRQLISNDDLDDINDAYKKYMLISNIKAIQKKDGITDEQQDQLIRDYAQERENYTRQSNRRRSESIEQQQREQERIQRIQEEQQYYIQLREQRQQRQREQERQQRHNQERNSYTLQDFAKLGEYRELENLSGSELLQLDEYDRSLYYYLFFSNNRNAILWLLNKNIKPPNNVLDIANNYRSAVQQKISNPNLTLSELRIPRR